MGENRIKVVGILTISRNGLDIVPGLQIDQGPLTPED